MLLFPYVRPQYLQKYIISKSGYTHVPERNFFSEQFFTEFSLIYRCYLYTFGKNFIEAKTIVEHGKTKELKIGRAKAISFFDLLGN